MKKAIILHGMPSRESYYDSSLPSQSNSHWLPWLQSQLLINDILSQTPELPRPFEPVYAAWREVFEQFKVDEETILVGHSCGGGFLVRWLSEQQIKVGKVVLVAPWIDLEKELTTGFFDFNIDPSLVEKTAGLTIFGSDDDNTRIQENVQAIRDQLPSAQYQEFHQYGHFTLSGMKTEKFPELLAECLK